MRNPIIAIVGVTGTGKSETQKILQKEGWQACHPIKPLKDVYCLAANLPEGALDTDEGKNHTPFGAKVTMQELMVRQFHTHNKLWPGFASGLLDGQMRQTLPQCRVTISGLRFVEEILVIEKYHKMGHPVGALLLSRQEVNRTADTDYRFSELFEKLKAFSNASIAFENNGTLEELRFTALHLASLLEE